MNVQTVLEKCRTVVWKSGLSYQKVGVLMGYPPESARQSVSKFLNGPNPSVAMLLRFAEAMGVEAKDLL